MKVKIVILCDVSIRRIVMILGKHGNADVSPIVYAFIFITFLQLQTLQKNSSV